VGQHRLWYDNAVLDAETILTPSSELATLPATFLQDQLRQKAWRTKIGWTVQAGVNDKLDFERPPGTPRVATIAPGTYATAQDYAAAIVTAMEAADSAPTWAVDYGVAAANKFRIRDAAGAPVNFNLMWLTGANAATSIGKDLGFDTSANDTGASTYTADTAVYQSRHYLKFNRSDAAAIAATVLCLLDPAEAAFVPPLYTLQGNATDSWGSPSFTQSMQGEQVMFFSSQSFEWWRLVIDATRETAGYYQLAKLFLGPYVEPSINPSDSLKNTVEDFSAVEVAVDGTHFRKARRRRDRWALAWLHMEAADKAIFDALESAMGVGQNFFLCWDKNDSHGRGDGTSGVTYGYMAAPMEKQYVPDPYWTYSFPFFEAL
jgi:hypothetical protein